MCHHPEASGGGESAEQGGPGAAVAGSCRNQTSADRAEAVNFVCYLVQTAEVDSQLVVGELALRALQHIVDALGDVEKAGRRWGVMTTRWVSMPRALLSGTSECMISADAATVGSAVDVDGAAIAEVGDGIGQLAGDGRGGSKLR